MLTQYKPVFEKVISKNLGVFASINPNYITFLSVFPPLLFYWALISGHTWLALLALCTVSVDVVDGIVARKFNKVTKFGGVFDSVIDRFSDFLFLFTFAMAHIVSFELVCAVILVSFLTSYIRSRAGLALGNDKPFAVGVIERTERFFAIGITTVCIIFFPTFTILGFSLPVIVFCLLFVLSCATIFERLHVAYVLLK